MPLYEFEGKRPQIAESAFVHPEATLIGGVTIGEGCYVGPGAVMRGDWGDIVVGDGSNIQENCIIHAAPDKVAALGPELQDVAHKKSKLINEAYETLRDEGKRAEYDKRLGHG